MHKNRDMITAVNNTRPPQSDNAVKCRREFLKKAGAFALYTPPTIMLLMQPSHDAIAASGGMSREKAREVIHKEIHKIKDEDHQEFNREFPKSFLRRIMSALKKDSTRETLNR